MAEKRMFTQKIIDSDAFLDMPLSSQALYFHLNMRADDDGFVNNPKRVMKLVGASEDDLKILLMKRFIIGFENGVIVIKHWRMHNTIKADRYHPTDYQEEFARLMIKDNKAYTDNIPPAPPALPPEPPETERSPSWLQVGSKLEPQISIREDIDKGLDLGLEEDLVSEESKKGALPPEPPETEQKKKGKSKSKKKTSPPKADDAPDVFIEFAAGDEDLLKALTDFEEMRSMIKKPLTDKAKSLLISKLKKEFKPPEWIPVLEQSIFHNWQGIFPIHADGAKQGSSTGNGNNPFLDMMRDGGR